MDSQSTNGKVAVKTRWGRDSIPADKVGSGTAIADAISYAMYAPTPQQYADQFRHREQIGEARLMWEILNQALVDLQYLEYRLVRDDLIDFFFGAYRGPFSFAHICEILDYEMERWREAIAAASLTKFDVTVLPQIIGKPNLEEANE